MKENKELVYDLAGAFVAIMFGCLVIIFIISHLPISQGTIIANVLTGGATLYAPIAAYYLLDNWKSQHKATLDKEFLSEAIKNLRSMNTYLYKTRSTINELEKIFNFGNCFIYNRRLYEFEVKDLRDDIFGAHAHLDSHDIFNSEEKFNDPYYELETPILMLFSTIKSLTSNYKEYCQILEKNVTNIQLKPNDIHHVDRSNNTISANEILPLELKLATTLNEKHKLYRVNRIKNEEIVIGYYTPYELINLAITKNNALIKKCIEEFKI